MDDDELLETYNKFRIKSAIVSKKNLIVNPSTIKSFCKPKLGLTAMRLQFFKIMKYLK